MLAQTRAIDPYPAYGCPQGVAELNKEGCRLAARARGTWAEGGRDPSRGAVRLGEHKWSGLGAPGPRCCGTRRGKEEGPAYRHGVWKVDSNIRFWPRPWASGQRRHKCD